MTMKTLLRTLGLAGLVMVGVSAPASAHDVVVVQRPVMVHRPVIVVRRQLPRVIVVQPRPRVIVVAPRVRHRHVIIRERPVMVQGAPIFVY
jgi:hypothetical protein